MTQTTSPFLSPKDEASHSYNNQGTKDASKHGSTDDT
jgi:hypothetical protein